ncbi:polyphosphate kinase 2, partial [Pseudomonadota bacterium]
MTELQNNPEFIIVDGDQVKTEELLAEHQRLVTECDELREENRKAVKRHRRETSLKPYQAELIRLQQYLEKTKTRMIILFEGRDAAGKGGTIRRVTRYMNEKHYRVVPGVRP